MRQLPSLRAIQIFEAAARLGSFLAASDELRLTPSAVSHQIRTLEQELGTVLFHRGNRSVMLTDVGHRYAEEIADALGQIEGATRNLSTHNKSDILTIHAVPSLATQWLMPRLARFGALNPDIDVRLNASGEPADLRNGTIDFSIVYGSILPTAGIQVEPFPEETIVALCSPSLAQGPQALKTPDDLCRHTLIHSEVNLYRWRDWARDHQLTLDLKRGPRFDRSFMAISTAVNGLGVCLESRLLVERELTHGHLVMPFGPEGARMRCHSLTYLRSRAHVPKLATFRQWLHEALRETSVPS